MKKLSVIIGMTLVFGTVALAQNEVDALRYSNLQFFGTARYMGVAGAFGAVGADFSTLSSNPAGLGLYKSSELVFTPSILSSSTLSKYQGESAEDVRYNLNFPNLGYVYTSDIGGAWKYVQFGFGMNKMASFNGRSYIKGVNPHNSMLNDLANQARNTLPDDLNSFSTRLAWDTYLLADTVWNNGNLEYTTAVPNGGVLQTRSAITRGAINEMVMSFAGNYGDKLYLGGTMGFAFLNYQEESTYRENDFMDSINDFKNMSLYDDLNTSGMGINFKFGMIYRPVEWVRVGAAIHTPTFYSLNDTYSREFASEFDNGDKYTSESPNGEFNYKLETPMRIIGSAALISSKYGLISADYEFVDYTAARLRSVDTDYDFFEANDAIDAKYVATSNLRLGAELRLTPFLVRGGYAIYGSPYAKNVNDGRRTYTTFGVGVREQSFFIDLAYVKSNSKEDYYLYDPTMVNPATQTKTSGQVVLSLGFRM